MKQIYTLLLLLFIFSISKLSLAQTYQKSAIAEQSDKKHVQTLLEKIVYDNIKLDTESERKTYSITYAKNIMDNNSSVLDVKLKNELYKILILDIDIYQKLGINTQLIIFNKLLEQDNSDNNPFFRMSYRTRDATIRTLFVNIFSKYFNIDLEEGTISEIQDANKVNKSNLTDIEIRATEILNYTAK